MAIKTSILSTVNGFITSIITQAKVRSALSTLLDNFYPTVVIDTQDTTTIFTKADTDFDYDIKTAKIGRLVNICGSIRNVTDSAISDQKLADITNTEYRTDALTLNHYVLGVSDSGQSIFLSLTGNSIDIVGVAPADMVFYFNGCYTSKD
jgi:hypothetical protein